MLFKLLEVLTTIMGILMSLSYFPQIYKILKNKSAKDISILSNGILTFGAIIWTTYGIVTNDYVIILSFVAGVVGAGTILALTLYYRSKN